MGFFDWARRAFAKPATRDNFAGTYGISTGSGFAGAAVNRLTDSLATWSGSVNADLDGSLVILRARARQLCADNEHGKRFLSLVANNVVGRTGPMLQVRAYNDFAGPKGERVLDKPANDAVEIHFARWGKKSDITKRMSFSQQLRVAAKSVARDGEALVRIIRNRKLPYGTAIQLLEADRLDESLNVDTPSLTIRQGVELDTAGAAVALYIKTRHPGETHGHGRGKIERVPVEDIIHLYLPERAEQVRGYTWLHAVLRRTHQLHGFNDAAVLAARIGASKVAALERAEEAPDLTASMADGQIGNALQMNIEGGEMFELPPGYKLSSWNPEYPHANFESFVKQAMRGIAAGLDVATHNLSGDMTDVNYSSARIAELSEREQWMVLQDWFIAQLVEPIYQEWLASAMLRGDITFEVSGKSLPADKLAKFANASRFQGRRWRWVDPSKELDAAERGVALGIISRTRITSEQGEDIEDVIDELAQEEILLEAAGLKESAQDATEPDKDDAMKSRLAALEKSLETLLAREHKVEIHNHVAPAEVNVEAVIPG